MSKGGGNSAAGGESQLQVELSSEGELPRMGGCGSVEVFADAMVKASWLELGYSLGEVGVNRGRGRTRVSTHGSHRRLFLAQGLLKDGDCSILHFGTDKSEHWQDAKYKII
jgi:hypothetical protein